MYKHLDALLAKAKKKLRTEFNWLGLIGFDELNVVNTKKITKAMFENKDAIAEVHTKGLELDVNKAVEGIPAEVPLHPGAAKYFKEIGVIAE